MAGTEGREPEDVTCAAIHCVSNDPFIPRWDANAHPPAMARHVLIAVLTGAMLASLPAWAQETDPQLDGAPPPLQIPKPAPPAPKQTKPPVPRVTTPAAPDTSLKAEQARLARLAAELQAQKARLDARATELAEQEKRLARERADQDADYARKLAELDRPRLTPPATASLPPAPVPRDALPRIRVSYDDARSACTRAGMTEAADNDFYSARYEAAPRYYERQRELRGRMRMDDREGYLTVDTICQLDANGAVLRFEVLG